MNEAQRFMERCKMTCLGGAERGTCPCERPADCEERDHPRYDHYIGVATMRMLRHFYNDCSGSTTLQGSLMSRPSHPPNETTRKG